MDGFGLVGDITMTTIHSVVDPWGSYSYSSACVVVGCHTLTITCGCNRSVEGVEPLCVRRTDWETFAPSGNKPLECITA